MEQLLFYIIYLATKCCCCYGSSETLADWSTMFTHSFLLCLPVSPAVFIFDSLKICTMASKEAYLATELDSARGCNLEDSNLAAVIEDYFEGCIEPVEFASAGAGAGEDHIEPALVGSGGADFPN